MEFESLSLTKETYGANKGRIVGRIEFRGVFGSVGLSLNPEAAQAMLKIVAEQMVEASKTLATNLTAEIIEQASTPALESL